MKELLVSLGARYFRVDNAMVPPERSSDHEHITDVCLFNDCLIVLRRKSPELMVLAMDGQRIRSISLPELVCGHGIRKLGDNLLGVVDMDGHKVLILNEQFDRVMVLNKSGVPRFQAAFNHPTDCVQSEQGWFYVSDGYGNSCIHCFDENGRHLQSIGKPGSGPAEFTTPHSILIDKKNRVCVADRENNRIQRLTLEGKYIDEITDVYKPMALAVLKDGTLLCTDQTPRLSAFSEDGKLIGRCRTFGTYAHGLTISDDGTIFVAQMLPSNISAMVPIEKPTGN